MPKLTSLDLTLNSLMPSLVRLIDDWQPGALANEIEYRNSLHNFLRAMLPEDCRIEREYRHEGTTVDLFVARSGVIGKSEVFLEIKRNLTKKAQFDRLVGQLEDLKPGRQKLIVIFIGDTSPAYLSRLKEKYGKYQDTLFELPMHFSLKG